MKKIGLLLSLLLMLLTAEKNLAQILNCNDLVFISLDQNCSHTVIPEDMLEGVLLSDCYVELDRTVPLGNGPFTGPDLGPADVGKTYLARVTHAPSGNACWGNIKVEDKLPPVLQCSELSTVELTTAGAQTFNTATLNFSAADACGSITLTPATIQYDCSNQGINTIQFTATDASGNSSTCKHSVLVTSGPGSTCEACVASCPESVVVSYDEGNLNLLPAFQSGDESVFNVFGNALFDNACAPLLDSFYITDYVVGTSGYSSFDRSWIWVSGAGQFNFCKQSIVFPSQHTVTIQGKIFLDGDDDCQPDAGEQAANIFPLQLTKLPSGTSQLIYPNPDGTYQASVVFGTQDVSANLHLVLPVNVNPVCATALNIPNSTATPSYTFDVGLQSEGDCPRMQVDIGNLFTRRCATNFFKVKYSNVGLDTAFGAFVTVNLDSLISLTSVDKPYTVSGPDSIYTFQLGDVPPFFSGTIVISAHVSCTAEMGQTVCNEAYIYPDVPCEGLWEGPLVVATAECAGDSVSLELRNTGTENMGLPLNYIVVEDFIMFRDGSFQLEAGESVIVKVPANGSTWRIESEQIQGFPVLGQVAAAVEGCGGVNTPGLINAFGLSENAINYDQDCSEIRASCDPNDKTAIPVGLGDDHIIRANQTIEYKIRFQNTGNDTAFTVVVVDTLPAELDPRSLELGASSHPYRLEIYPGGILHFVFKPIVLPDSNINEVASHGYLEYRIAQQPDLPDGTVINNRAAIYFDQNEPVFTNTAFHTIGYPIVPLPPLAVAAQTRQITCHGAADGAILLEAAGGAGPYSLQWSDVNLEGDTLTGLAAGTYYMTLTDSHGNTLLQSFEITEPAKLSIAANATPTLGNDNSGAITASVSGGTGDYTYLWSNGATTETNAGLAAGTYTLLVSDANGCTQSSSHEVLQTVLPLVASVQITQLSCNGDANGAIQLSVSGGLMPYTTQWNNPSLQGNALTGLSAGSYHVTLTDSFGGEWVQSFELTEPTAISLTMNATAATGNDNNGTASAAATGGTGTFSYLWNTGAITANLSGLSQGTYTVLATDQNGCTQSQSIEVPQTILPLIYNIQQTELLCFGDANGAILVNVTGGLTPYDFQWNNPALEGNALSGLPAGNYSVTVTDANGSTFEQLFVLNEPLDIVLSLSTSATTVGESNGSATAQVSGGTQPYQFLWNTGATTATITGLPAGTYTVITTDAHGCTASSTAVVEQELVGAHEPNLLSRIQVWPNPAHDRIMLDLHQVLPQLVRMDLLGPDGRVLQQFKSDDLEQMLTLNLDNEQAAGIVLLVLYDRDGGIYTRKVVVY